MFNTLKASLKKTKASFHKKLKASLKLSITVIAAVKKQ